MNQTPENVFFFHFINEEKTKSNYFLLICNIFARMQLFLYLQWSDKEMIKFNTHKFHISEYIVFWWFSSHKSR